MGPVPHRAVFGGRRTAPGRGSAPAVVAAVLGAPAAMFVDLQVTATGVCGLLLHGDGPHQVPALVCADHLEPVMPARGIGGEPIAQPLGILGESVVVDEVFFLSFGSS